MELFCSMNLRLSSCTKQPQNPQVRKIGFASFSFVYLSIVILKDIKKLPLTEVNFTFPATELTWR